MCPFFANSIDPSTLIMSQNGSSMMTLMSKNFTVGKMSLNDAQIQL